MKIAVDGPAGSGKSTIAKRVAAQTGFLYVDTGAMYRAMALFCLRSGTDYESEAAVEGVLENIAVTIGYENGMQMVYLNGENVSEKIRTEAVSRASSVISAYAAVRAKLLSLQRELADGNDVIMDGRDIGTQVLPDAECKIFLTASVETRAKRRYDEQKEKGMDVKLSDIEADIRIRDKRDSDRAIAPLKKAADAVLLDTSDMDIEEVTAAVMKIAFGGGK